MTILTKVYYISSITLSLLTAVSVFLSLNWEYWETVSFDMAKLHQIAAEDPTIVMEFPQGDNSYFIVAPNENYTSNASSRNTSLSETYYVPLYEYGGLWRTCDLISDGVRSKAKSEGHIIPEQCHNYHQQLDLDTFHTYPYLEILTGLTRSADACGIVAMVTVFASTLLGLFALARHQIFFAMITGVTYFASGTYTIFSIILMLLRKAQLVEDVRNLPSVIVTARSVQTNLCVYLATGAVLCSFSAGAVWVLLSMHLKKIGGGANFMNASNYDQICSK